MFSIEFVKIKKNEYKDLPKLLKRLGLIDSSGQAHPSNYYVSIATNKLIESALKAEFKKQYKYLKGNRLKSAVGMELLNLGPAIFDKGIETGYAMIIKGENGKD